MHLSRSNIPRITPQEGLLLPGEAIFNLPEKIVQFGTGVLLRGLPDHFINVANHQGIFNGRIVMIKSTATGDTDAFNRQNGLYTLCLRGVEHGKKISYNQVISSVSRVLSASGDWEEVLACAADPNIQIILSNTTEIGISMSKDNIHASPPESFPGKLLAFLYHRYKIFNGAVDSGMVIIPTELIPDNADKLLAIVLEQAHVHGLEADFIDWLENANHFCNSLVDRIVPGKIDLANVSPGDGAPSYRDDLAIMAESYGLWAIQTNSEKLRSVLSFAAANKEIVLTPAIDKFSELKIRLLNGSHTFSCGIAVLAGFNTVKEAMEDESFSSFISSLMYDEIAPAIESDAIPLAEAKEFAGKVLDRYRNPFIEHQWASICTNASSKMHMRNVPLLEMYAQKAGSIPTLMSLGMAAHILYMKSRREGERFYGSNGQDEYLIADSNAAWYHQEWADKGSQKIVEAVLANKSLWDTELNKLEGFAPEVDHWLQQLLTYGAKATLEHTRAKMPVQ